MKFKLVEDTLSEKVLVEATTFENELAEHILSDLGNTSYKPKGFKSMLNEDEYNELLLELSAYCRKRYNIKNDKALETFVRDILDNWTFHHIDGVHKTGKYTLNNKISNLAIVKNHSLITEAYKDEIKRLCAVLPHITGSDNVDKLIYRTLMVCLETKIPIYTVFSPSVKDLDEFQELLSHIPKRLTTYFENNLANRSDVILLSQVDVDWRKFLK